MSIISYRESPCCSGSRACAELHYEPLGDESVVLSSVALTTIFRKKELFDLSSFPLFCFVLPPVIIMVAFIFFATFVIISWLFLQYTKTNNFRYNLILSAIQTEEWMPSFPPIRWGKVRFILFHVPADTHLSSETDLTSAPMVFICNKLLLLSAVLHVLAHLTGRIYL